MKQIKSRKNVRERGEVFTAEREVKAMCDLVGEDIANIEKRVLEPAAGNGNFLVEILQRRLDAVMRRYENGDREFRFLVALSNIYAVELCTENVAEAKHRLKDMMLKAIKNPTHAYAVAVDAILETNVIHGNYLTKRKSAIPIFEYVPNYEKQTFDITRYTLHEIKRNAGKRRTSIAPIGIGECVDSLKSHASRIRTKSPIQLSLFPSDIFATN